MNDGITPELCSLSYMLVDHVAEAVTSLRAGALLAKVDIESVHPQDWALQAVQWQGHIYVDSMLPFGPLRYLMPWQTDYIGICVAVA